MRANKNEEIEHLKKRLRTQVSKFCSKDKTNWKDPIIETLNEIKNRKWQAVIFGGTLRSLMLGSGKGRRPRDIDIVIKSISVDTIQEIFSESFVRKTRFGGVKLQRENMEFDIWPIDKTWSFVIDKSNASTYENLPKTTFLNIEAVAIDIWPHSKGKSRNIYTDNDSFFKAIINKTLEINKEENPFPTLCVVRSIIMAANLKFKVGTNLSEYLIKNGENVTSMELEEIQMKHYGKVKIRGNTILEWIDHIKTERNKSDQPIALPYSYKQLNLWNSSNENSQIHIYCDS